MTTARIVLGVALVVLAPGGCQPGGEGGTTAVVTKVIDMGWAGDKPITPDMNDRHVTVRGYLLDETKGGPRLAAKPEVDAGPSLLLEMAPAVSESEWKPLVGRLVCIEGRIHILFPSLPGHMGVSEPVPTIEVGSVKPTTAPQP